MFEQVSRIHIVKLALHLHDFGKHVTLTFDEVTGQPHAYDHENETDDAVAMMHKMGVPDKAIPKVLTLINTHMLFKDAYQTVTRKSVSRLLKRLKEGGVDLAMWCVVAEADSLGRGTAGHSNPHIPEIRRIAAEIMVDEDLPEKFILGRHLIKAGYKPGKAFTYVIDQIYAFQLETEGSTFECCHSLIGDYMRDYEALQNLTKKV